MQLSFSLCHILLGFLQLGKSGGQLFIDTGKDLVIEGVNFLLVQLHLDALLHKAHARDAGNAVLPLQEGNDGVFNKGGQLENVIAFPADGNIHGGHHIHADFDNRGRACHIRQGGLRLLQRGVYLYQGGFHIRSLGKFQLNHAVVFRRRREEVLHALNRAQGVFQRTDHILFHPFRACAGVGGNYHQIWKAHVGKQVGGHPADGYHAQYQHQNHGHQYGKGLFNAQFFHVYIRSFANNLLLYIIERRICQSINKL